jgi:hypothetical protein
MASIIIFVGVTWVDTLNPHGPLVKKAIKPQDAFFDKTLKNSDGPHGRAVYDL